MLLAMYRRKKSKRQERAKEKNCCHTYGVHLNRTEGLTTTTETRKNVRRMEKEKKVSFNVVSIDEYTYVHRLSFDREKNELELPSSMTSR
jgi:hypothetical protein